MAAKLLLVSGQEQKQESIMAEVQRSQREEAQPLFFFGGSEKAGRMLSHPPALRFSEQPNRS